MSSCPRHREQGFTLIEIFIALVLMAIVVGFMLRPIADGTDMATSSVVQAVATHVVDDAAEQFRNDLSGALAPDRDPRILRDDNTVARGLAQAPLTIEDPSPGVTRRLDLRDIVQADPNSLTFRADVLAPGVNAPTECVQWAGTTTMSSPPRFTLTKRVWNSSVTCPGTATPFTTTILDNVPVASIDVGDSLFLYDMLGGGCGSPTITNPEDSIEVNRITSVTLQLSAVLGRGRGTARDQSRTVVPIKSRTSEQYREMLGC